MLHLFKGSEIRHQIFYTFDMQDRQHENRQKTAISLLEKNYKSNGTAVAFNTWKNLEHYHTSKDRGIWGPLI